MERRMPVGPPILPPISVGLVNMSHKSEKLLICPYNKAHAILSYRMQNHLLKCRKQHQDLEWGFCVHNATHQMPVLELEYHQTHACVDRHSFQASRYTFEAPQSSKRPPMAHMDVPEPSEDWDDGVINTFDPKENAAKNSIIRGKHCVPPSERKAFRIQHRRELLKRMEEDSSSSLNVQEVQNNADQQDNILEPLRTPQELPKGFSFGRGSTRTDGAPGCPGVSEEMAKLSMNSDIGTKSEASSVSGVEWLGLGRGKRSNAPTTTAVGAMGAWGRGRPKV